MQLGSLQEIGEHCAAFVAEDNVLVLDVVEAAYDEAMAREHVSRTRDLTNIENSAYWDTETGGTSVLSRVLDADADFNPGLLAPGLPCPAYHHRLALHITSEVITKAPQLPSLYPTPSTSAASSKDSVCLRALSYSGWNPPPGNRRLQGRRDGSGSAEC